MEPNNSAIVRVSDCESCPHRLVCKYVDDFKEAISKVESLGYTKDSMAEFQVLCKYLVHYACR